MMNLIALCLVFSTIFSGGIFNPSTQQDKKNTINQHHGKREDLIIKEANRVIMVEYEREAIPKEDTNNYSPPSSSTEEPSLLDQKLSVERSMASGVIDSTRDKLREASSVLPNLGQGVGYCPPSGEEGGGGGHHFKAKELICDAYGKCKHKIAGAFGKGKDTVSEKAKDTVEKTKEGLEKVKDSGEEAIEKAKEMVYEKVRELEEAMEKAKHGVGRVKDQGKETGERVVEKTKEELGKAKDSAYETGELAMEKAKEGLSKVKEQGKETGEKAKEGLKKAKSSVSEKAQELKQKGKEAGEKTKENVVNIGIDLKKGDNTIWDDRTIQTKLSGLFTEGTRNFSNIFHKGTGAFFGAVKHSVSKEVLCPTMGVLHLLGLATAYGISIWVTFLSSHVLAGALPRQQFGIVQSKIYPAYFRALVGSIGCALFAYGFRNPYWGLNSVQTYNMLASLGLVLLNLLYFEPRASKVMFDKMKLEKEEGRGAMLEGEEFVEATATIPSCITGATATTTTTTTETSTDAGDARREEENRDVRNRAGELNRQLKNLNSVSSLLNVLTLMALTWQLVYLGRGLPVS